MKICSKCTHRTGIGSNEEAFLLELETGEPKECIICSGILWELDKVAEDILNELGGYEFDTFLVGTKLEGSIKALELYLLEEFGISEEKSVKFEFNRELGLKITELTGKEFSQTPDVTIIYNFEKDDIEFQFKPLYIYGRYLKKVRNIPQTRWACKECKGAGCKLCNYSGKKYFTSVEELIIGPCLDVSKGKNAFLHGSGREDVDARMLGNGRPFVVEIQNPVKRNFDVKVLEKFINDKAGGWIEVNDLSFTSQKEVEKVKATPFKKTYRAEVIFDKKVSKDELSNALKKLSNQTISQRTPKRVEHRRADLIRKRNAYDLRLIYFSPKTATIEVDAQSGLYIKELISGDNGRTTPSLSEVLNNYSKVTKLDVIKVWDDEDN